MMSLGRAEPAAFEHQDAIGEDARDAHAGEQRDMQQERKTDRAAEKFGEVRRHRRDLADDPERPDDRFWKMLAAQFGQIAPGDDAELGRQRLEQHRREACRQHHPQEGIAVFRPGPDVGGEIAGVHIGDRSDDRGARKQQRAAPASSCRRARCECPRPSGPSSPWARPTPHARLCRSSPHIDFSRLICIM